MAVANIYRRIGNRGAGGSCPPGNTIESIAAGLNAHADMIEVDVRGTKDHVLLLSQSNVQHYYGKEVAYNERDYAEWETYFADHEESAITLQSALEFLETKRCGILLDVKEPGLENALARVLRAVSIDPARILLALPSDNSRVVFRALNPNLPIAHKIEAHHTVKVTPAMIDDLKTEAVFWHPKAVTFERVERLHKRGIIVYAGPANLAHEMKRLKLQCEVDGIASDLPEILASVCP
jgi:glycerophosphoryl diester phosphodiesterase